MAIHACAHAGQERISAACLVRLCGKLLNASLVVAEERYAEVLRVVVGTPSHLQRIAGQHIRVLKDAHHASVPVLQGDLQRQTGLC